MLLPGDELREAGALRLSMKEQPTPRLLFDDNFDVLIVLLVRAEFVESLDDVRLSPSARLGNGFKMTADLVEDALL